MSGRSGDRGISSILGIETKGGELPKSHDVFHLLGNLDELSCMLSLARSHCDCDEITNFLYEIQHHLFDLGAHAAGKRGCTFPVERLEQELEKFHLDFTSFVIPGGRGGADYLDLARAVARRAERYAVAAGVMEIVPYLNRLSYYLFLAARHTQVFASQKPTQEN